MLLTFPFYCFKSGVIRSLGFPVVGDRVVILFGEGREDTGRLLCIEGEEATVKLDSGKVRKFQLRCLGKMMNWLLFIYIDSQKDTAQNKPKAVVAFKNLLVIFLMCHFGPTVCQLAVPTVNSSVSVLSVRLIEILYFPLHPFRIYSRLLRHIFWQYNATNLSPSSFSFDSFPYGYWQYTYCGREGLLFVNVFFLFSYRHHSVRPSSI